MKGRASKVPAVVALAVAVGLTMGAALGDQTARFEDRTSVVAVEIPVQVVRDGEPVRGLTAEDFQVRAAGELQPLRDFEVIDLGPARTAEPEAASRPRPAARRHFLLLFDLSFSDSGAVERAREAARRLVGTGLHPTDLVAVGAYRASRGAELLLGFTTDRRQLELALDSLAPAQMLRRSRDPLNLVLLDFMEQGTVLEGVTGFAGNKGQRADIMAETARDLRVFQSRDARDQRQNEILALSSAMGELARLMASVPGRKQVVFLSEGFDSTLLTGSQDFNRLQEIAAEVAAGEHWRVDSEERFGSTAVQSSVFRMLEEFRRADCAIQTVDISGIEAAGGLGQQVRGEDGLFLFARETGGEFFRNDNDLERAVGELMERTSVTYLLTIQPEGLVADGSYYPIKVRLNDAHRGTRLVHRPGFYAPRPYAEQTAEERRVNAAGLIMAGSEGGDLDVSMLATPFPRSDGPAYVPVLMEIDGRGLLGQGPEGTLLMELYGYALDREGSVADYFAQALTFELDKVGERLSSAGLKFWGSFDLPPGDYLLRVLVRNGDSGAAALRALPLHVPARSDREAGLLPPLFPEPEGKWLLMQEPGARRDDVEYPFVGRSGAPFVPAARPVVAQGAQVPLSLVAYHLGGAQRAVGARLLGLDGEPVRSVPIHLDAAVRSADGVVERIFGRLDATGVEAGFYELEVTVRDPQGEGAYTSSIPVVIEG